MNLNLWSNCVSIAERAFFKSRIYQRIFHKNNADSQDVLSDIANFCGVYDMDLRQTKQGSIDPLDLARRAGKIEVYQYISKHLSMNEEQKNALAMRYFALQNKQQEQFK